MGAQIGAESLWATCSDRAAHTAPARAAFEARFEREVDPEGVLPPQERAVRAAHARKAYFRRIALKSAQARAARKAKPPEDKTSDEVA